MNWLTILLIYLLCMRTEGDFCKVERVFFLENDFWVADQLKIDKGYLYKVKIGLEARNMFNNYSLKTVYSLKSTNLGYLVLNNSMIKHIASCLNSPKDEFIFVYYYDDKPMESFNYFEDYKNKLRGFTSLKLLEKDPENRNIISLKCCGTNKIIERIKDRLIILSIDLLKFNEYIEDLKKKRKLIKIKDDADFNLYYFKNHSECLTNLQTIVRDLVCFKLLDDESSTDKSFYSSFNSPTTLKISEFRKCLRNKLKKMNDIKLNGIWKDLLNKYLNCLEEEILNNNIHFLISGKYNIDFYIDQLSNLIYNSVKQRQKQYLGFKFKQCVCSEVVSSLRIDLEILNLKVMTELCESEFFYKHFSNLVGKNIEIFNDYNEIDKIVCDFNNIFEYIKNFSKKTRISLLFLSPISTDNYKLRIIDGIKILINRKKKFENIRGINTQEEEVAMLGDTDYFMNENILYVPSVVLKMKNIREIEVKFFDEKDNMRLKVNDFLSIC